MLYLRARFYNPADGRFQSRDTWEGDENNPITLNRWVYANANPIRYIDPSGNSATQSIISTILKRTGIGNAPGGISGYGIDCSSLGNKPDWYYFAIGTLDQYLEDMTIGLFKASDNYNTIQVYQQGRNFGQSISLTQAMIETIIGLAVAEAAISSIPPSVGGGAVCAGVTEGVCAVVAIPIVGVEVLVLIGASLINLHGAAIIARSPNDAGGSYSTGRGPRNAREQAAWDKVRSDPFLGRELPLKLGDPRWPPEEGWVKMTRTVDGVEIHWNLNKFTGAVEDMKIK